MRLAYSPVTLLMMVALMSGCAMLGAPAPDTFNEKLATGYVSVTAVRQQATSLVNSGALSADDARKVQSVADQARAGLDMAAIYGAQPDGQAALVTAVALLTELQRYLVAKGPQP